MPADVIGRRTRWVSYLRVSTNHQAERDLRMRKVQQKISGTFRDTTHADAFCRLRSYLATLRKQGQAILAALTLTLRCQPPMPDLA